jgi:hypothetical protein
MNRAERRRMQKKQNKKEPVYNISGQNLDKIKQNERKDAINDVMILLLGIPVKVMREHYGFGDKRLPEFAELLCEEFENFSEGDMTLEQYAKYVYEHTGIKFVKN